MAPSTAHVTPMCECRPVVFHLGAGHPSCASCGRVFVFRPSLADRRSAGRALQQIRRTLYALAPITDDDKRDEIERPLLLAAEAAARLKHGLPARKAPA